MHKNLTTFCYCVPGLSELAGYTTLVTKVNYFPSHVGPLQGAADLRVSLAFSRTPADTARPRIRG